MNLPQGIPEAVAAIRGNSAVPGLRGVGEFYKAEEGTWISLRVWGLPRDGFFALHIHEGSSCAGKGFRATAGHWNPTGRPHPEHWGDLPPLLSYKGAARTWFWAGRIPPRQVIGKTLVIHSGTDDFQTQPSGDPGEKIGCGEITKVRRRV